MNFPALDFSRIKTYPIQRRANKVSQESLAKVFQRGDSFAKFYDSLPHILVADDFRNLVQAVVQANREGRPVIFAMGAHPIKCGLNPVFINLMQRDVVNALMFNGAGGIHDFELAYQGETSEDVLKGLEDGSFGMIDETGRLMNQAFQMGNEKGWGAGKALGQFICDYQFSHKSLSLLATATERKIPTTLHIAIGTDIIHQHPTTQGAVLGEVSYRDFQTLAAVVAQLEGGVFVNFGSTVIIPEVFLKALTVARNLGHKVEKFTTATFDMKHHYRPAQNVVSRPVSMGGKGYYIVGHHEIMIPLFAAAILEEL
ncbi:MAG: hypothetical protein K1X66_07870 [Verrucomicrobiae bacterium]|nr:hypothetical protein [Verrucomicrobiae bacterium]